MGLHVNWLSIYLQYCYFVFGFYLIKKIGETARHSKQNAPRTLHVETTGSDGAGHAVDKMDAASKAPDLLSEDIP